MFCQIAGVRVYALFVGGLVAAVMVGWFALLWVPRFMLFEAMHA